MSGEAGLSAEIEILEEDGATVLAALTIDGHRLHIIAEVAYDAQILRLERVHVEGASANAIGLGGLYRLACWAMRELSDVDQIVVLGAVRTSGVRPGHRPRPLTFHKRNCRSLGLA